MANTAKKAIAAEVETANSAEVANPVMRVSKPEPEPETTQPEPKPHPASIEELKVQICDRYNLVEKHEVLMNRLQELKGFEANITADAKIRIENGSGRYYNSADPRAVSRLIFYSRESLEAQISNVEAELLA